MSTVKTIALGIEFNGANYRGWQRQQAGVPSVQKALEDAISTVANESVILHAAGRTDAGVHASNMVAHFTTTAERAPYNWVRGINTLVANDIAVRWATPMPTEFHARFKACARRYHYAILQQSHRPALLAKQVTFVHQQLSIQHMQQAVNHLVGTHDFTSFRAAACQSSQPVRTVEFAQFYSQGDLIVLDIKADGFLHHMVRNIIGSCLAVGLGEQPPEWIAELIHAQDRTQAAATAPPDGLYFVNAYYPKNFVLPSTRLGPAWLYLDR